MQFNRTRCRILQAAIPDVNTKPIMETTTQSESSSNVGKSSVWKKPCYGSVEGVPIMGDKSWPSLYESVKASLKLSALNSSETVPDGSISPIQVPRMGPSCSSPVKTSPSSSTSLSKCLPRNVNHDLNENQGQCGSDGADSSDEVNAQTHENTDGEQRGTEGDHRLEQHISFRSGNHERHFNQNHGERRNQARENRQWSPFLQSFPSPMVVGFPGMQQFNHYPTAPPGMHFGPPPIRAPLFFHPLIKLYSDIRNQIEYYFSFNNLISDIHLRQNMDQEGWVSIAVIAKFNKVKELTDNIQLILNALQPSTVIEIQGDKIRRRYNWERWILPATLQFPS